MVFPIFGTARGQDEYSQGTSLTYWVRLTKTGMVASFCGDNSGYTRIPTIQGEGFFEDSVGEVEVAEAREGGERRNNRVEDLVCSEGEVGEEWEVGDVGKERAEEVQADEVEGGDMATIVIDDTELGVVRDEGVPRRKNGW